jgi:ribosomal protein S27AE
MVTATGVGMVMVGRAWPTGGRHRARVMDDESLLNELLGPVEPQPVHGGVLAQAWRYCPSCERDEPSVLHTDGWTCGHCFHTTTTTGDLS